MKKVNDIFILIIGIIIFLISYNFDQQVNLFFKNFEIQFLDIILSIVTNFWIVILIMLIIPSIIIYKKNQKIVHLLLLTFIVAIILAFTIKLIVSRQRPMEIFAHPNIGIINYPILSVLYYSFPSMHAMVAFALLPILIEYMPKQKSFWITFVFLVAFSRLYFGFHFLSDIVFGALFGYFIGNYLLELYKNGKIWIK